MKDKKILFTLIFLLILTPSSINAELIPFTVNITTQEDLKNIKKVELVIQSPSNKNFTYFMFDDGKHEDGEANDLQYGVVLDISSEIGEIGKYTYDTVLTTVSGEVYCLRQIGTHYLNPPEISTDAKIIVKLFFDYEYWDVRLTLVNEEKENKTAIWALNMFRPISSFSAEINDKRINNLNIIESENQRIYEFSIYLNPGPNHLRYFYEKAISPFTPDYTLGLPFGKKIKIEDFKTNLLGLEFHIFPLDNYFMDRPLPFNWNDVKAVTIIIDEIPRPYVVNPDKSGLSTIEIEMLEPVEGANLSTSSINFSWMQVQKIVKKVNYAEGNYIIAFDTNTINVFSPSIFLYLETPLYYKILVYFEIILIFLFVIIRLLPIKKLKVIMNTFFVEKFPLINKIPYVNPYWTNSGVTIFLTFTILVEIQKNLQELTIPRQEFNGALTLLDWQTWGMITLSYIILFNTIEKVLFFAYSCVKKLSNRLGY